MTLISPDLSLFIKVAETKGFSTAARLLGLTPSTVMRRVEAFEHTLGTKLFIRSTHGVALTDAGQQLLQESSALMAKAIDVAEQLRLSQKSPSGLLRLTASIGFGRRYVAPRLGLFRKRYPEIRVELRLEDSYVDLVEGDCDLAVRIGVLPDSNLRTVTLGPVRRILCASPGYLAERGTPLHLVDIRDHDCIVVKHQPHASPIWAFRDSHRLTVRPAITVNTPEGALAAALGNGGIVYLPNWLVCDPMKRGELIGLLPDFARPAERGNDVHLVWPENPPTRTKVFIDFLRGELDSGLE